MTRPIMKELNESEWIYGDRWVLSSWLRMLLSWLYQKPWLNQWRQHRGQYAAHYIFPGLISWEDHVKSAADWDSGRDYSETELIVAFVFEKGNNDHITKIIWHYLFFPYASQDIVECMQGLGSSSLEDFSWKAINSRCFAGTCLLDCFLDHIQHGWRIKVIYNSLLWN